MIYLGRFCCLCLDSEQKLEKLFQKDCLSYYDKLRMLIPEMDIDEVKKISYICRECRKCTDDMFGFRTRCLRNNDRLRGYISRLRSDKNERITSQLVVVKHEMIVDESTGFSNVHADKFIQFENDFVLSDKDINIEEEIKEEILDYVVFDDDRIETGSDSDDNDMNSGSDSDDNYINSGSDSDDTFINSESASDNTSIYKMDADTVNDIPNENVRESLDTINENVIESLDTVNENVMESLDTVNDNMDSLNTVNEDMDSPDTVTVTNKNIVESPIIKDIKTEDIQESQDTENDMTNPQIYESYEIKTDDIKSLHTEIDIGDSIKNEVCDESVTSESFPRNEDTSLSIEYIVQPDVVEALDTDVNPNPSFEPITDDNIKDDDAFHLDQDFSNYFQPNQNLLCTVCNESFTTLSDLKDHILAICGKPYRCETCHVTFDNPINFEEHNRNPLLIKPYECKICYKRFHTSLYMNKHYGIHTGNQSYTCEICSQPFLKFHDYKTHKRTHTDSIKRFYECEICGESFIELSDYTRHKLVHSNEKQRCEICDKYFKCLALHIRVHGYEKSDTTFPCKMCNKSFNCSTTLKRHYRTHTGEKPYRCEICNKSFRQSYHLTVHSRIHTGEKPYKCEECNKTFSVRHCLVAHSRVHTGAKLYKCEICNKDFRRSHNFQVHKRIHTGEKP